MTDAYRLENINVSLQQKDILSIDHLVIKAEQCTTLFGNNGAGKSTLLKLLAFTHRPTRGDISLFSQTVSWPLTPQQRKRIAFVEQHPFLLPGTVYDNIKLALSLQNIPASQHHALIKKALEETHTAHLLKQNTQTLSGGELKRVAIARAIAYQPDILLLDEPFSHLDIEHIEALETLIKSFSRTTGKTVILSTHNHLQGTALSQSTINLVAGKVTSAPLENRFSGYLRQQQFFTEKLVIETTSNLDRAQQLAIDPKQIIISNQPLESSMQNCFSGQIIFISEQATTCRLIVDCKEQFHATISLESLNTLKLQLGSQVYLSFKSSSVLVF